MTVEILLTYLWRLYNNHNVSGRFLNLNKFFFTCTWFSFRPQAFNFYNQDVLVKMNRCCCCYSVPPPRTRQISRSYFLHWSRTWKFFLHCLFLKYVSDHFRWGNVPVNQNKLRMCLHFDQIRTCHRCFKLSIFGWYIYVSSLKTVPSGWAIIESFLRDHWPFTTVQSR